VRSFESTCTGFSDEAPEARESALRPSELDDFLHWLPSCTHACVLLDFPEVGSQSTISGSGVCDLSGEHVSAGATALADAASTRFGATTAIGCFSTTS
jgi:hypothetical protein